MIRRSATVGLALLAAAPLPASARARQPEPVAIIGVSVVDVISGRIAPNRTVSINGGVITAVVPAGAPPAGARVVDGRGKFLIPGLWDMHFHLESSGESSLPLNVANGVTGLRDMGSNLDLVLRARGATAAGEVLGPRIFAAGPILDDAPGDWPLRIRVKNAAEGRAAVRMLKERGVDLIKVHDHTPRDAFLAIADEARKVGLPLAGHVPAAMTVQEVIDAGQTDIEHLDNLQIWKSCPGTGYRPGSCKALFAMLAKRGIWQTPTLVALSELATIGTPASAIGADRMAYVATSLRELWAMNQKLFVTPEVIRQMREGATLGAAVTSGMAAAGVPILVGCDTMVAGFCVHDELAAMVRGGMTPLRALQAATINPARYFGLERTAGTVAVGRRADLVLLDGNPLADIANVGKIRAVVVAGRFLDRSALDRILTEVKAAVAKE